MALGAEIHGRERVLGWEPRVTLDDGLARCAEIAEEFIDMELKGARVAVQGYGNVGQHAARAAAGMGAEVVVFPEAYVPGYPTWIWRLRPGGDMKLTEQLHVAAYRAPGHERCLLEDGADLVGRRLHRHGGRHDETLGDEMRVTVIAAGFDRDRRGSFSPPTGGGAGTPTRQRPSILSVTSGSSSSGVRPPRRGVTEKRKPWCRCRVRSPKIAGGTAGISRSASSRLKSCSSRIEPSDQRQYSR